MITALQHNLSQRGVRRDSQSFPQQHRVSRSQRSDASMQRRSRPLTASQLSSSSLDKRAQRKRAADSSKSAFVRVAQAYKKSRSCMLFTSIITLASCVFYVAGTYIEMKPFVISVESIFALVFFVDYVLSLFAAPVMLGYALSFGGIVDLLSIFPVLGALKRWLYSLSFVRYLRLGKVTRVMQNHRLLDKFGAFDDVTVEACLLGLKVAGLIFMTTAIIYGTEQVDRDEDESAFSDPGMQWHDALYFTIVTLSTVGYGDVFPVQVFSRMLVMVVILFALTYVPLEVGNLVDVISSRPKNRSGFPMSLVGGHLHVVLAMVANDEDGQDSGFEPRSLRRMIEELCHEDHGMDNESLWVVVMAPCPPSPEVQLVVRSPRFLSRVIYYRGSVMDPLDMAAVCAEYADCIFLYPGSAHSTLGVSATEEKTTLAAKALQRYLDRTPTDEELMKRVKEQSVMNLPTRTLVTVKDLRSKNQLLRFGIDHVICHDELKMSILACATLFPAFLPFAINAMRSSSDPAAAENPGARENPPGMPQEPTEEEDGSPSNSWLTDYKSGMEYEVYSLPLLVECDSHLFGMKFNRAALDLFRESKGEVLLMAVVRDMKHHPDTEFAAAAAAAAATATAAATTGHSGAGGGGGGNSTDDPERFRIKSDATEPTGPSRNSGSKVGGRGGRVSGSSAAGASDAGGGGGSGKTPNSFVHVSIFPGENFCFSWQCNVLVLAEDKEKAQFHLGQLQAKKATPQILPLSKDMDCDEINASGIVNAVISGPGLSAEVEEDSAMSPTLTATADASSSRSGGRGGGSAGAGESGAGAVGKGIAGSAEVAVASCSPLSTSGASEGRGEATDQNDEKEDAGAPDGGGDPLPAAAMVAEERAAATAAANMSVAPTLAGTGVENSPAEIPADGREELSQPTPTVVATGTATASAGETPPSAAVGGGNTTATTPAFSAGNPPLRQLPPPPPGSRETSSLQLSGRQSRLLSMFPNKSMGMDSSGKSFHRDRSGRSAGDNGGAPFWDGQITKASPSSSTSSRAGLANAEGSRLGAEAAPGGSRAGGGTGVATVAEEGVGEGAEKGASDGGGGDRGIKRTKSRRSRPSMTNSLTGAFQTEEEAAQLEAVRNEMRNEDGTRWTEALEALKAATEQLNKLEKESGLNEEIVAGDPAAFFSKVSGASRALEDALQFKAATVPEDLKGHFVVIGAHPRLQHYVVALRRQRPSVVIVVVTDTEEIFFELRERLAEFKLEEEDLNVSKIYAVFGKRQDRATFEEARVKHAETVLLVSNEPGDSDVLLVSFELEQMLEEMDPRAHSPKVLIDLHNDNSIYYCGNSLGGRVSGTLRRGTSIGKGKEAPSITASGVWEWPLFAAGSVWTESIMEVFAVQTYFSSEFLAFFETVLQIRRPVLLGSELVHEGSFTVPPRRSSSLVDANSFSEEALGGEELAAVSGRARGSGTADGARTGSDAGGGAGAGSGASPPLPPGQFDQLRVLSSKYRGERYEVLAEELITRGAMPLGLYRPSGTKGSTLPYTHVNPDVSELLVDGDIVFVLRSRSCPLVGWV